MAWAHIEKAPLSKSERLVHNEDQGTLWVKCHACHAVLYRQDFLKHQNVCTKCEHHFPIGAKQRIEHFLDHDSFDEYDAGLSSTDPLSFRDTRAYRQRLQDTQKALGMQDAIICGRGLLMGRPVHLGVFDFRFMGGSMGCVVGEKITRLFQYALKERIPAILVSASGGARMQEGLLSLMQMAKTCAALGLLRDAGIPFISVLTNPTMGGVAASYAMLGDINIAEPGALIGFAGPRVIEQTIRAKLPEGFQTAEFLQDHGMLDFLCHRDMLRPRIAQLLSILCP